MSGRDSVTMDGIDGLKGKTKGFLRGRDEIRKLIVMASTQRQKPGEKVQGQGMRNEGKMTSVWTVGDQHACMIHTSGIV